jgi:hypothetical protein
MSASDPKYDDFVRTSPGFYVARGQMRCIYREAARIMTRHDEPLKYIQHGEFWCLYAEANFGYVGHLTSDGRYKPWPVFPGHLLSISNGAWRTAKTDCQEISLNVPVVAVSNGLPLDLGVLLPPAEELEIHYLALFNGLQETLGSHYPEEYQEGQNPVAWDLFARIRYAIAMIHEKKTPPPGCGLIEIHRRAGAMFGTFAQIDVGSHPAD